ncbi:MAG TPA: hypothetical protein VK752_15770 [Bryobacteraceae bacterium]|nr:hypothetical protein [Bryobacteraceae bacterium]
MRAFRLLDQFISMKGQFGPPAADRTAALLEQLKVARLRNNADLIRAHETVLFLRAYPQSPQVLRLADQILFSFADRLPANHDAFADPDISGIAGTVVSTNFSHEFVRSLLDRHQRAVVIDWDAFEHPERLAAALRKLIPLSRDDWAVEAYPNWRGWFEKGQGTLQWLLDNLSPEMYDLFEVPVRWDPGMASRSHLRIPRSDIFYHDGPLLKREPNLIAKKLALPPIPRKILNAAAARKIAGTIVDASAVRYRELYGFLYPNLARIEHADLGRGTDVFLFAPDPLHRLPVRDYLCGMFFKNGVPAGYVEGLIRDGNMEVGFNLYYTFRDGETAWLYAMLLKLLQERSGVKSFSVDPYQIGHDNEEAIESGAFWFYRKLGFAPELRGLWQPLSKEEERIEAQPGYRTPPATLRKLAAGRLVYRAV